jgi:hypothetical protein
MPTVTEIRVVPAPATKTKDAFNAEVRKAISTIANLAGWSKDEREHLMEAVEISPLVATQWGLLQEFASRSGHDMPVWEWNRFVRAATDHLVETFYRGG